jgi:hypothetical protein
MEAASAEIIRGTIRQQFLASHGIERNSRWSISVKIS